MQYQESSFDFVTRLMEQYGLYYYFTHDEGVHTLVFADDANAHTKLPDPLPFVFDQTEFRTVADHFWEWSDRPCPAVRQVHPHGLQFHHAERRPHRQDGGFQETEGRRLPA